MKTLKQNIHIPSLSGKETIARADDVFGWIDSDFENWDTDKKGNKTEKSEVAVCELTEDMTFAQIFNNPEEMSLSQAQIVEFCKNNQDDLNQKYYTFFLFKVGDEFFVASVYVNSVGRLYVYVDRFGLEYVWRAGCWPRIVLPQLALKHLDADPMSSTLPAETSVEARLQKVEQFMEDNFNLFHT